MEPYAADNNTVNVETPTTTAAAAADDDDGDDDVEDCVDKAVTGKLFSLGNASQQPTVYVS